MVVTLAEVEALMAAIFVALTTRHRLLVEGVKLLSMVVAG